MQNHVKKVFFHLVLIFIVSVPGAFAKELPCKSIPDTDAGLMKQFGQGAPEVAIIVDETFANNDFLWPEIKWKGFKAGVTRGQYRLDIDSAKLYHLTRPMSVPRSDRDILMEVCFKVEDKSQVPMAFGLIWDVRYDFQQERPQKADAWTNKIYEFALVNRDGEVLAGHENGKYDRSRNKVSGPQSPSGKFTLSVLRKKRGVRVYLNGVYVYGSSAKECPRLPRMGFMVKESHGYKSTAKVFVESLKVMAAPTPKPAVKSKAAWYREFKNLNQVKPLLAFVGSVLDIRTNLVWRSQGYEAARRIHKKNPLAFIWGERWAYDLNREHDRHADDWRMPTAQEYKSIYKSSTGQLYKGQKLGYPPEIDGRHPLAMTGDSSEKGVVMFSFLTGTSFRFDFSRPEALDLVLVRTGPLDLFELIKPEDNTAIPLSPDQEAIFERITAAYKAGLPDSGDLLFNALLDQAGPGLYHQRYTERIARMGLPLTLSAKILTANLKHYGQTPAFWYEAAHMAVLAHQPALVLNAVKQLRRVPSVPEFKEQILDLAALFEAIAYMSLEQEDKAYTALLMRLGLKNNILLPYYLNSAGGVMLKDKKRLATVLGIDEALLTGEYRIPKAQDFYNIETGQLVKAVKAAPKLTPEKAQKPPETPAAKEPKTPGATVLD
jgi:hypothetical protein